MRLPALVAAAAVLASAGCGGGGQAAGDLVWAKQPLLFAPETLPGDRVLSGRVRNDSLRPVEVAAGDLRVVTGSGDEIDASAVFLSTYAHQLFPPGREPRGGIPEQELRRLGVKARIEPGKTVPVTISWHQGRRKPVRVDTGAGSLPIP